MNAYGRSFGRSVGRRVVGRSLAYRRCLLVPASLRLHRHPNSPIPHTSRAVYTAHHLRNAPPCRLVHLGRSLDAEACKAALAVSQAPNRPPQPNQRPAARLSWCVAPASNAHEVAVGVVSALIVRNVLTQMHTPTHTNARAHTNTRAMYWTAQAALQQLAAAKATTTTRR